MRWFYSLFFFSLSIENIIKAIAYNLNRFYSNLCYGFYIYSDSFNLFFTRIIWQSTFGNRHFWSEGYYVSTVGLNDETVAKYIREQEMHDIAMDKLSVKEYANPFSEAERLAYKQQKAKEKNKSKK